ncbi:MAG: type VI secretion system tip protein VgrG [Chitinophagaceae bacterium]|nr:type VI secretion system tip protein VgrG [Chitinophagaceae bacterium]
MSSSKNINIGTLVTFSIKVNGSQIPDEFQIFSLMVEKKVNRISTAHIVILDGSADNGKFDASSSSTFVPGNVISIEAGYDTKNRLLFKGIITQQSVRIGGTTGSSLKVVCKDVAIKTTIGRKSFTYSKKRDSDIISSIIGNYGIASSVTATTTEWPEQVQYYVSDWDYIVSRAEANGMIVNTINGTLFVQKPDARTASVLTATFGDNLYECNTDLDAVTQLDTIKANSWDYKNQALNSSQASNNLAGPGNLSSKKLSGVVGLADYQLQSTAPLEEADLSNWSKAQMIKTEFSKIRGEVKVAGTNEVEPAHYITLSGLGDRFNGDHFVSGVVHKIDAGDWVTEISIGLSPSWFIEDRDIMSPPAAGLVPGVRGLYNAKVKKIFDDPDSQYRILVDVPLFDENGAGIWARLSNFYATPGAGAFFLPEVGDEIVLGFLNEDPRYPVILGSLYSSPKNKPYQGMEPNEQNQLKAIVSKSGIFIEFDDVDKILTISTPAKNKIVFSDKDKQIYINDENGNSVIMSQGGIDIKSPKDINISADQKINIKGSQGVTIGSPGGDVNVSGINIKENAQTEYSANGSASAKFSAGGELTINGVMVMIN